MNKPTKITVPEDAPAKRGSLLERASGTFGLGDLRPAAVPVILDESKAKKFVARQGQARAASVPAAFEAAPASAAPAAKPREADAPLVRFGGARHEVVRSLLREQGLVDPDDGATTLLEELRIIKRQVIASAEAAATRAGRRVLISSPHPNEGKTFCAINLAIAMAAERDREVLLIDADFGKPSIMGRLGLQAGRGFMDALADKDTLIEDLVVGTDVPGLWVLPAGERTGSDSEYLASERTAEVLDRLTNGAPSRLLVFDSPPALAASPAAELAKHVGQVLLVVRADCTARAALEDAVDLLSGCADIRLLLNDATFSPSGRKFGTYYGYGEQA